MGDRQEFQQLVRDALAGKAHQIVRAPGTCLQSRRVGVAAAEARVETKEAQNAQMVFGNALQRVADESNVPALEVVKAAEIVEDLARPRIGGQSVDGEVAARGVLLPVIGKGDRRAPAVGGNVATQRRHLNGMAIADRSNGPMINSCGNRLDPHLFEPLDDLFGTQACGKIDIVDRQTEQLVAYSTADVARQALVGTERIEYPRHAADCPPLLRIELQLHCSLRERLTMIAAVTPQILRPFHKIS